MNAHPKPARVDLGDGDSLILFRTDDYHTTVRFHSANPNTSLAGAVMATDALRAALDKITPAESPDLMDGGVTCAAIENETLTNEARNEQARIDHIHEQDRIIRRRNEQLAEARADLIVAERREQEFADRADKAERALADVHERDETVARLEARLIEAEKERDHFQEVANTFRAKFNEADSCAEQAECHDCIRDAAVIETTRTLTADDVTDAMADRFLDAFSRCRGTLRDALRAGIEAMSTPEPQRPEGASDIEAVMLDDRDELNVLASAPVWVADLADFLAERGVRVATEEE